MTANYEDIIHLPHHVSSTRPQMPMSDRAAQFSPFAALVGYDAAIEEAGRITDEKIQLTEEEIQELDRKFQILLKHLEEKPTVSITYFKPNASKDGGAYLKVNGSLKKLDSLKGQLTLEDNTKISMTDVLTLDFTLAAKYPGS